MSDNRLQQLNKAGQSIWLDFIDRTILRNGDLARRIRDDALTGMTSNPTIFEKALAEGSAYDEQIRTDAGDVTAMEMFELSRRPTCATRAISSAPTFDRLKGADGFVSIEVSPGAANDAQATIAEAQRLWATVGRPNVMIKVPGTVEGAKAVRALTAAGINVNITLLFAIDGAPPRDRGVPRGARGSRRGGQVDRHDPFGGELLREPRRHRSRQAARRGVQGGRGQGVGAQAARGKAAIANAKLAYRLFQERFAAPRWQALAAQRRDGAAPAVGEHEHEESGVPRRACTSNS